MPNVDAHFGDVGGTGIALHGGYLYLDTRTAIVRYKLGKDEFAPTGNPDTIVRNLPTGGHGSRNIAFDRAGLLYVNIGSRTNSCQTADRQNQSPGIDPCTELETRAGIWRFDAAKPNQTPATGEHVVTGIRNAMGLALNPMDGKMYATQHGRDQLAQNWSSMYAQADGDENPAEEFVRFHDHSDFGWPYCYYDNRYKKLVLAPEYGGDGGHKIDRCASKEARWSHSPATGRRCPSCSMRATNSRPSIAAARSSPSTDRGIVHPIRRRAIASSLFRSPRAIPRVTTRRSPTDSTAKTSSSSRPMRRTARAASPKGRTARSTSPTICTDASGESCGRDKEPTRAELLASAGKTIKDLVAPGLSILFVGINPGLYTALVRHITLPSRATGSGPRFMRRA